MAQTLRRLGLTLPIATHDGMKKLCYRRSAEAGEVVTLTDLYAEAIVKLAARIDQGEEIAFVVQPRGTVRRVSLRLPPDVFEIIKKHAPACSQSAIVAKSAQQLLQGENSPPPQRHGVSA